MCNVPPKFYQLCRLCLSDDKENALFIFDKAALEKNIAEKIMTCLSILVSKDDYLPNKICLNCSEQIETLYMFVELAKKTENVLHEFLHYTKELKGTEEERMRQSVKLLENLTASMPLSLEKLKQEPPEIPIIKSEIDVSKLTEIPREIEIIKREPQSEAPEEAQLRIPPEVPLREPEERSAPEPPGDLLGTYFRDAPREFAMEAADPPPNEPLIKVKPVSELHYAIRDRDPAEPTDLSNKRGGERVTCAPEIDHLKDDAVSVSSSGSDPERLEVDMSQIPEEFSHSTTPGEASPARETARPPEWPRNGHEPGGLMGDAGQLLRRLMGCRKLGMSVTPTPHVLNYTLFKDRQSSLDLSNAEKSSARRKQSFPSKANVQAEPMPMEHDNEEEDSREGSSPDFTGNSPWCNLVKGKSGSGAGKRVDLRCTNCGTQTTTIWRRNLRGEMVCNACGLYFKLHGIDRPVTMRRDTIHTRRRRPKATEKEKVAGQHRGRTDTEDMLSALRRQIQPHLVRALQGHRHPNVPVNPHIQVPPVPRFLPSEVSVGCPAREAESDEDSIADLPLNLVSTQMTEGELL